MVRLHPLFRSTFAALGSARSVAAATLAALALVCGAPAMAQLAAKPSAVVVTPHVRAELIAHAPEGIAPGSPVMVGLQLVHQPEWHTYWKNAGDSGLPTELAWTLPPGLAAGDIAWPVPRKIPIGNLANYGYEDTIVLPVPVTVAPDFKPAASLTGPEAVDIRLKASWLVCRKECIPEEGDFQLRLPVKGSTAVHKDAFDAAMAAQPAALAPEARIALEGQALKLQVDGLPDAALGKTLELFPETPEVIHTAAVLGKDWTQSWNGSTWTATVPLAAQRSASPATMPWVLALANDDRSSGQPVAWRVEGQVRGEWPTLAPRAEVSPALRSALEANAASQPASTPPSNPTGVAPASIASSTFLAALLGALVGGLLLNLMPCVFPVLAIKVLAFTRRADDRRGHRIAALAYSSGVVLSFLALGGALLALRMAGAQLGWGFQLQSPAVVAALAALFTLIGLNLAGMYEFRMLAPASVCSVQARHPVANDFLSGVLAVVIASPCTAPFMGASMGLAIGLPAAQALLLFAVLGLGLALPYLVAGFVPAVARLLPKPGAWMDTLRRLLAFPMFATVAWLVWVLGQQSGIDGAGALLALLVSMAAIVWALTLRGRTRRVLVGVLAAAGALLLVTIGDSVLRGQPAPAAVAAGERWQPWSADRTAQLVAAGQPVFVDFTAAWCVTCQYNKRTTLGNAEVLADFDARKVALLRADWTRRDPAITAALNALGRSGVPVYVLHAPGRPPQVMTEILDRGELQKALASL
ncbi:Thiol:disulfide interchange protein DsbD [Burkholderiales bacterium 8X]|nr:Thiol:disulfide interchange protein DsbD [Burkholderiales bacterium 8X]